MTRGVVNCTECGMPLPWQALNTPDLTKCRSCGAQIRVDVFPALFDPPAPGEPGETLLVNDQSSCFYHPQKKAVVACDNCGRFLCALCDVEFDGRHLCPTCLETGARKGKVRNLQTSRVLYDDVALALAVYPLLVWFTTIITAPVALYIAIRYWRAPSSLVPRTKARFVVAMMLAGMQIIAWTALFVWLIRR
jgi:hypothetical protein